MANFWMILAQFVFMCFSTGDIVNVALHKTANMSSIHDPGSNRFPAANGVDGNTTSIIHTRPGHTPAWWTVDLGTQVQDALVTIFFRLSYQYRRNGIQIYTSMTPFSFYPGGQSCLNITSRTGGTDIPNNVSVTCSGTCRHLMVYSGTNNGGDLDKGPILHFGEVTVLGCDRTYGQSCDKLCSSRHCIVSSTSCDRYSGACPGGCAPGWKGTDCLDECSSNEYGRNCINSCSSRHCEKPFSPCNRFNGSCSTEGCQAGWKGIDCTTECSMHEYGRNCANSCSTRQCVVSSTTCNRFNGSCSTEGCQAGWMGMDCTKECNGTYGKDCEKSCSSRHCAVASSACDRVTGVCPFGGCTAGWYGADCSEKCPSGTFGVNCAKDCSVHQCKNSSSSSFCDPQTGQCPNGCQDGWMGGDCNTVCPSGKYGVNCMENCGHCNGSCDAVNGRCPLGCLPGFCGTQCQNKLADDASLDTDLDKLTVGVIGSVIGIIVAIVVGVVVLICLVRRGRLQWNKSEASRQSAEMSHFRNPHGSRRTAADNPQTNTAHVYNNDYSVLDSTTNLENRVYDVLHDKDKDYQNV